MATAARRWPTLLSRSQPAQLHILYGTQTGNAEGVAMDAAVVAKAAGMQPAVEALDDVDMARFATMKRVIIVASTYGEGEMPDNAQLFWEALSADSAPRLESMHFGVLALGDTGYDGFCQAGKLIDTRLEQLGAHRLASRLDCDIDYEDAASAWVGETMPLAAAIDGWAGRTGSACRGRCAACSGKVAVEPQVALRRDDRCQPGAVRRVVGQGDPPFRVRPRR
jgi:sulfite reductase alpha subunit-like flavoprotein